MTRYNHVQIEQVLFKNYEAQNIDLMYLQRHNTPLTKSSKEETCKVICPVRTSSLAYITSLVRSHIKDLLVDVVFGKQK